MSPKVIQCAVGIICAGLLSVSVGCAGKKFSTSASDQTMMPGEKLQAEAPAPPAPSAEVSAPAMPLQTEAATAIEEAKTEAPVPRPESPGAEAPAETPKMEDAKTEQALPPPTPSAAPPVEEKTIVPPVPSVAESVPSVPSIAESASPAPSAAEEAAPAAPPPSAPPSPEEAVTLADVFFDFDRFSIRKDAQATLEANARWLKTVNGRKVLVEGHCDERGTVEYNLVLGEKRAQSVKQYLQELGVPASQIQITSFGKERPFCTEHSDACWQQNRRAHFVLQ